MKSMPKWSTWLLLGLAVLLLGVVLDNGWPFNPRNNVPYSQFSWILRPLAIIAAIAVIGQLFRSSLHELENSNGPAVPDSIFQPDRSWLRDRLKDIYGRPNDTSAAQAFVELIIDPARYRTRVIETIGLDGRSIVQEVSVEFALPVEIDGAPYAYLPVLLPIKGELVDNFSVYDNSGNSLPNLSYDETTVLVAMGIQSLLEEAASASGSGSNDSTVIKNMPLDCIDLLELPARRDSVDRATVMDKLESLIQNLRTTTTLQDDVETRLRTYLTSLSFTYPLVILASESAIATRRVMIKYKRVILQATERKVFRAKLRLLLGMTPHQLAIPTNLAVTAASYHLRVNGPSDKYIDRQYFRCRHCNKSVQGTWMGKAQGNTSTDCEHNTVNNPTKNVSHFRLRRRRGQSYAHLYMRGYSPNITGGVRDLELALRFKETPPGSRAYAAATALVTTLVTGAVGYMVSHHIATSSDLPALLLALPVIGVSWFGGTADIGRLVGASLLARLSLLLSGALSLVAVACYLVFAPDTVLAKTETSHHHAGLALLGVGDWQWIVIVALSLLNFMYVLFRFMVRLVYYDTLRSEQDLGSAEYISG